ncbi:MAG TPA: hypothetical protein VEJ22_07405 [Nitrospirota bacterium]|nr:hypothetical protein [Nitrospirota bacterium]
MMKLAETVVLLVATLFMTPAFAQNVPAEKPADNTQIMLEKIKADKKALVAANMDLTEPEAKRFWPLYETYQTDLEALNKRMAAMIKSYADALKTNSMDNEKAKKLTATFLSIQADEVRQMQSYVPLLSKVLPATKVARYLQIENKIRTIIKSEMVAQVPLVPGN